MTGLKADDKRKTVLIVDNSSDDIDFMSSILKDIYRIEVATSRVSLRPAIYRLFFFPLSPMRKKKRWGLNWER